MSKHNTNTIRSNHESGTHRTVREGLRGVREPVITALKSYSDRVEQTLSTRKDMWVKKLEVLYRTLSMMKRGHRDEEKAIERCNEAILALSEIHKAEVESMGSSRKTDTLAGYIAAMEILVMAIKDDTKRENSGGKLRFSETTLDSLLKGYSKTVQEGGNTDEREGDLVPVTKEYLLSTADTFQKFEKPKLAEQVLKTLQRNNPDDVIISFTLGKLFENTRNYAHAITEYESIVATKDKRFAPAYYRLARCWQIYHEIQKAIDNFEKFLSYSQGRRDPQVVQELASLYSMTNNFERSNELFQELFDNNDMNNDMELLFEWVNSMARQIRTQLVEKSKPYKNTALKMENVKDKMQKIAPNDWRTHLANMHVGVVMKRYETAWTWIMAAWEVVIDDAKKQQQKQEILEKQQQLQQQLENQQQQQQQQEFVSSSSITNNNINNNNNNIKRVPNLSEKQDQISRQQKNIMLTVATTAFHFAVVHGDKSEYVRNEAREFRETFMKTEMFDRQVLAYIRAMTNGKIRTNNARIFDVVLEAQGKNEEDGNQTFLRKYQVISDNEEHAVQMAKDFESECQNEVIKVERSDKNKRLALDPDELGSKIYEGVLYASGRILFERQ